jgi:hypothetical protein
MKSVFLIVLAGITLTFKVREQSDDEINRWEQNSFISEASSTLNGVKPLTKRIWGKVHE